MLYAFVKRLLREESGIARVELPYLALGLALAVTLV